MECRPLDITILSANGLKDVNMFSKMDVYVVVTVSGDPRTKQKTPVDKDGHTSPKWNYSLNFSIDETAAQQNRLMLIFNLISDRNLGDKPIGEVHVPVKELLHGNHGEDEKVAEPPRDVSYSVRTPAGKSKGTFYFSYKFGKKFTATAPPPPTTHPVTAYPAGCSYPPPGMAGKYPNPTPPVAGYGYPQPQHCGPAGYGYPPHGGAPGYGYHGPPQQPGYGYGHVQPSRIGGGGGGGGGVGGAGLGLGMGAGLLGGLLIGDMVSDASDMAAYDAGFDDAGGFDF